MNLLLNLMLALYATGEHTFITGFVPSESGFEGAVTVVSESVDGDFGVVTVNVPYRDIYGKPQVGLARLVVHRREVESGQLIPAFCHVHYEKDVGGAKTWAEKGWAVTTAVYDEQHPIDAALANGNNLARAILQWVRRLPFIDRTHLHIDGGSQGGYMALAMSAEFFPVVATTADAPVVNWAYNLNYLEANKPVSKYPASLEDSPLPVMCAVTMLADWCYRYFGNDLSEDTWYWLSPIAYLDRITNPVLLTAATGDMLVPMEQMTRDGLYPFDLARFPEGYQRDFDALTLSPRARHTFEELIPEEQRFTFRAPLQENSFEFTLEHFQHPDTMPEKRPQSMERRWSLDHPWSLFYLDEGPPAPQAPHTTYFWSTTPQSFVQHYQHATISADTLNEAKLERLMQRYVGELANLPMLKEDVPVNQLNFAVLEQRDVLQGLLDFADLGEAHATKLMATYGRLETKPFGEELYLTRLRHELWVTGLPKPDAYPLCKAAESTTREGLPNVFQKLESGEKVSIGYLGGSITAQPGWRPKTLKWFQDQYPQAKVSEINAAIGGTGSDLGVYRLHHDVLQYDPDLLFVEFAVNDGGAEPERILRSMEGIIRQTWRHDPNTDICLTYTLTEGMLADLQRGRYPRAASVMEVLADHYGIPSIHMGFETAHLVEEGTVIFTGAQPRTDEERAALEGKILFSPDSVHPYPEGGHELYLAAVARAMQQIRGVGQPASHLLGKPVRDDNWERATMLPLSQADLSEGWQQLDPTERTLANRFGERLPELWVAERPGEQIRFRFRGTDVQIYDLLGPDCGQVIVRVDEESPRIVPRFDAYCTYHRLAKLPIASGLPDTEHTVILEIHPEQVDKLQVLHQRKENHAIMELDPALYDATKWYAGAILVIGEILPAASPVAEEDQLLSHPKEEQSN